MFRPMVHEHDIEELDAEYKRLVVRRDDLRANKARIEATLDARKKNLKKLLDEAKGAGFNPDNLPEEIRRTKQVLRLKLDNFGTELNEAQALMEPMLREIDG